MVYGRWHIISERWFKEEWYVSRDGLCEDSTLGEMDQMGDGKLGVMVF